MDHWVLFLIFTILSIAVQGIFALFEMASLSLSRIRLQYFATLGKRNAIWLSSLLASPSRFFGTTLIGINAALLIGSECARKFYEAIHLDPDFAPLTQVFLVVVFGELSPMFTARRYPTQIALRLAPLMIVFSKILMPLIWTFDFLSKGIHKFMGKSKEIPLFFSREEVAIAFREREEGEDELSALTEQIFQLKNCTAGQIMTPLNQVLMVPHESTVIDVRYLLGTHYEPVILLYKQERQNVVSVVSVRDLMKSKGEQKVIEKARSPWFVTKETSVLAILDQFRKNNQSVAVILDLTGQACGILTLDQIVSQIFGREEMLASSIEEEPTLHVERTLSGEMLVEEFNREFQADVNCIPGETLSDLLNKAFNYSPSLGASIRIGAFVFTVMELSLREIKKLSVRSVIE